MVQTTPMHVAAVCGNVKLVKPLIDAGHPTQVKDRWGRIPLDTACLQMWTAQELVAAFGPEAPQYCKDAGTLYLRRPAALSTDGATTGPPPPPNLNPQATSFVFTEAGGGYKTPEVNAAIPSTCAFDIVDQMTTAEFQHTYVSPRRPVLVRGGTKGAKWDSLRKKWSRSNIAASHPDVMLKTSSIPYANVFGFVEETQELSLQEYIDQVMEPASTAPPGAEPPR